MKLVILTFITVLANASQYPLLDELKQSTNYETFIQYLTDLVPKVDRNAIDGDSIEAAASFYSKKTDYNAEQVLICFAAFKLMQQNNARETSEVEVRVMSESNISFKCIAEVNSLDLIKWFISIWLEYHRNDNKNLQILQAKSHLSGLVKQQLIINLRRLFWGLKDKHGSS